MMAVLLLLALLASLAAAAMARHRQVIALAAVVLSMVAVGVGVASGASAAPLILGSMAAGAALVAAGLPEERLPPVALAVLLLGACLLAALQITPSQRVTAPETLLLLNSSLLLLGTSAMMAAVSCHAQPRRLGAVLGLALAAVALLTAGDSLVLARPLVAADGAPLHLVTWREAAASPLLQAQVPHMDAVPAWIFLFGIVALLVAPVSPPGVRRSALALPGLAALLLVALPLFSGPAMLPPEIVEELVRPGPGAVNAVLHPSDSLAVPTPGPVFTMAAALGLATVLAVQAPHDEQRGHMGAWRLHLALVLLLLSTGLRFLARLRDGSGPVGDPVVIVLLAAVVVTGTSALAGPTGRRVAAGVIVASLVLLVAASGSWW